MLWRTAVRVLSILLIATLAPLAAMASCTDCPTLHQFKLSTDISKVGAVASTMPYYVAHAGKPNPYWDSHSKNWIVVTNQFSVSDGPSGNARAYFSTITVPGKANDSRKQVLQSAQTMLQDSVQHPINSSDNPNDYQADWVDGQFHYTACIYANHSNTNSRVVAELLS